MSELRDIAGRPAGVAPRKLEPVENLPSPSFRTKGLPRESFGSNNPLAPASSQDIAALFAAREGDRYAMHASHLNEQMVRVLRTIGYDVGFCRGSGQYLFDRQGVRYLDLLSGFGVFAIGRNHSTLSETLKNVLNSELPNLVQLDVSTLAGILAERLLAGCVRVPFDDLPALEQALSRRDVAAFIVEPIQGKGVNLPSDDYLKDAAELCRRHGTLFIADEIQTGLGRTGRFLAVEHWGVEPDMVLIAKALSGGHVPSGAVLTRKSIYDRVFNRMDRAVVHGSTFAKNDLAMAAGLATLDVIESEGLISRAERLGDRLLRALNNLVPRYELLKEVRGKGLMIGIEFGEPSSFKLKASWNVLESASKGLFCQLITIPLFKDHKVLCQVAGHSSHTIKILPSFVISDDDCDWIVNAFDAVIASAHRVPGAVWSLGKTLVNNAVRAR